MEVIIKAMEVKKEYLTGKNKTLAINNISFDVFKGEKLAITGPSGCGKTTLLNILGLIVKPTSGNIIIDSKEISSFKERERARYRNKYFGYIVQDFALIEEFTVYENIEIPLLYTSEKVPRSRRRKLISELLTQVGLEVKINEKVKNLSGGQRQRVAIARAIVNDPEIILADEPTGSLDSKTGEEIMTILDNLVQLGKTLILITHDNGLAQSCDRQIKLLDGKITEII
ncbi:ABC transporter ATP-binding protein [Anaerobranca gottschalkii]|uniref:Putative ABC transport system ATP-binding protein n=1 Tax=Anaerobranca gottschalkii DSM 13577 TaxID=1120990 RepID=A0A1H9YMA4_9FIRM|nr:ABC transporter ATP-binding protein [Anaerobranca gottschalkii]SES70170.1 putative ABC transport system ATP-binding protein [Anaerobranca gottschalkii DSM 13577]